MNTAKPRRLRNERIRRIVDIAQEKGARIRIEAATGDVVIDFPSGGAPVENEEGLRLEAAMRDALGAKR
jgi:hypothetical protein